MIMEIWCLRSGNGGGSVGIRFQGRSIPECQHVLPAAKPGGEPLPEELRGCANIPDYVYKAIDALPITAHPMTQFTTGVMAL
ncbi:citrate synthase, mitochondrial [Tanacetum coccineum]